MLAYCYLNLLGSFCFVCGLFACLLFSLLCVLCSQSSQSRFHPLPPHLQTAEQVNQTKPNKHINPNKQNKHACGVFVMNPTNIFSISTLFCSPNQLTKCLYAAYKTLKSCRYSSITQQHKMCRLSHWVPVPLCSSSIVLQFHLVPVPLCSSPIVFQFQFVPVPSCHSPTVFQSYWVPVLLCSSSIVSQFHCVPVSLYPSSIGFQSHCTPVPLCPSSTVFQFHCASVPV